MSTKKNKPATRKPRKTIEEYLAAFGRSLRGASEKLLAASREYVSAVDDYGDRAVVAFGREYPGVSEATWGKMLLVGRGGAVPEIIMLSDRTANAVARLDVKEQARMLGGKKTVAVVNRRGKLERKPLARLTPSDEKVAFDESGRLRTEAQQRAYLAARASEGVRTAPWEITGNILVVHRAVRISRSELVEILERMAR